MPSLRETGCRKRSVRDKCRMYPALFWRHLSGECVAEPISRRASITRHMVERYGASDARDVRPNVAGTIAARLGMPCCPSALPGALRDDRPWDVQPGDHPLQQFPCADTELSDPSSSPQTPANSSVALTMTAPSDSWQHGQKNPSSEAMHNQICIFLRSPAASAETRLISVCRRCVLTTIAWISKLRFR